MIHLAIGCENARITPRSAQDLRLGCFGEYFFSQLACATALDGVQVSIDPLQSRQSVRPKPVSQRLSLICSVNGDVNHRVLRNVAEVEAGHDDQFLRLETYQRRSGQLLRPSYAHRGNFRDTRDLEAGSCKAERGTCAILGLYGLL